MPTLSPMNGASAALAFPDIPLPALLVPFALGRIDGEIRH